MHNKLLLGLRLMAALALASCATTSPQAAKKAEPEQRKGVQIGDLDRKADPCTDFFEFANGTWRAENPIPATTWHWSRRYKALDETKGILKGILDEISQKKDWPAGSDEQLVGDHYGACMDEAGIDAAGLTPLAPLLAEIDGAQDIAGVQRAIGKLHQLGVQAPFGMAGALDYHQPLNFIANLTAGGQGLPDRDYYSKAESRFVEARERYLAHIGNVFKLAGMPDAKADSVFNLEKRLAEASLDSATAGDPAATDHKMTFAELKQLAPGFDWGTYFDEAKLPRAALNVAEPKFMQQLDKELKETPVAEWKTYLKWQLLEFASPWLGRPFAEESFAFRNKYLEGAKEMAPRWQRCVDSTEALLVEPLAKKYSQRYFPPAAKVKIQEIAKNLVAALKEEIAGLDWMGPETKKKALAKLDAFNPQLGYPDKWKDYSGVTIVRSAFWANVAAGRRFNVDEDRKQIGKPSNRSWWQLPPTSPLAYIDPQLNELVFPAGFLQPPVFSLDVSDAVNYGAVGVGMGHEILHAIDTLGAGFDTEGHPQNWWSKTDLEEMNKRAECLVDQFEHYYIEPGNHHNGKLVLSESIADLAGARIAYLAFKRATQSNPAPVIDGFTPEQQFFIAWGQFRGDAIRPERQRLMIKADNHPVSKFRVMGPFSNLPEFQQAFSCKEGAEMVRPKEKRCAVW